jgi:LSD1 subclass zinc finger protein
VIAWEYFCHGCSKLLLYVPREKEKPVRCAKCHNARIEVAAPGSEKLARLRFGDAAPDAPLSAIVVGPLDCEMRRPTGPCRGDYGVPARCQWCGQLMRG